MELHTVVGLHFPQAKQGSSHCNSNSSTNAACIQVVLPQASQDHKSGPAPDEQLLLFCPYQFSGDPSYSHYLLALSLCHRPPLQFLLPPQQQQEPSLALPPLSSITQLCISWWETLSCFLKIPLPPRPEHQALSGCVSHRGHQSQRSCAETHHLTHLALNLLIVDLNGKKLGASVTFCWPQKSLSNKLFSCHVQLP